MKLPFTFGVKLVFRILLPGFILSLGVLPVLLTILEKLSVETSTDLVLSGTTLVFGWLFVVLDMPLYMAFEGRRYWPAPLRRWFVAREQRRLERLLAAKDYYRDQDRNRYVEVSVELRYFPTDDEDRFEARFPTRLGNLLAAYEDYPNRAYGMDSVFYWYRIWLVVENDLREEIDGRQALADSTLYSTTALYITGTLCAAYIPLELKFGRIGYLPAPRVLAVLAAFAIVAGYFLYRLSLYLHAQFGEIFKSLFDMYREKVNVDSAIDAVVDLTGDTTIKALSSRERFKVAWRYLHNNRIKLGTKILTPTEVRRSSSTNPGSAPPP